MANPLLVRAAGKAIMKSPAGKRLKKKGIEAGKKLLDGATGKRKRTFTDQYSTSNSTVRDRLTKTMKTLPIMSTSEAAKAAAVSATAGYLLGKKDKK